jgi:hypothetical protein
MKIPLLCLLLTSGAAHSWAAEDTNLAGKWQIHNSISGNESDQVCTLTQKGTDITGSCTSPQGPNVEISGKINGNKVTLMYKSEYNGTALTVNYQGVLDSGTKITGSVNVPEFGAAGDFTATQSK